MSIVAPSRGTPGMLVAGRYQLVDALGDPRVPDPLARWQARDTLLGRRVVLCLVPEGPIATPVLAASRAAAQLTTGALVRVLDVLDSPTDTTTGTAGHPDSDPPPGAAGAIVTEWVEGETLEALLLREGPVSDALAQTVGLAVGDLLTDISRTCPAQLGDLLVRPADVVITPEGRVAVALDRTWPPRHTSAGPAEQVALVVYAALTGRWPAPLDGRVVTGDGVPVGAGAGFASAGASAGARHLPGVLVPAEGPGAAVDGAALPSPWISTLPSPPGRARPGAPHQVRAGIDARLDALVTRALSRPGAMPLGKLVSELQALDLVPAPDPLPQHRPRMLARSVTLAIGAVLAAGLGLLTWQATGPGLPDRGGTVTRRPVLLAPQSPSASPRGRAAASEAPAALPIRTVQVVDSFGDGHEHDELLWALTDHDPATSWRTALYYRRPDFGGLKPGLGLLLDLGAGARPATITVSSPRGGGSFDVYASASPLSSPPLGEPTAQVADEQTEQSVTLGTNRTAPARWVLLWWRRLPPALSTPESYRLEVRDLRVTGWTATGR